MKFIEIVASALVVIVGVALYIVVLAAVAWVLMYAIIATKNAIYPGRLFYHPMFLADCHTHPNPDKREEACRRS